MGDRPDRPDEGVADGVALLWERFRGSMVERLEILESMGLALLDGRDDPDLAARSLQAAHKLHGALGTFGRARGSVLAAELESLLESLLEAGSLDSARVHRFTELVVALRSELEEPAATDGGAHPPRPETTPTFSLDPDPETGLPSRAAGRERLTALLGLAERFRVPVTVALLRASGPDEAASESRVAAAAKKLASQARPGDVVARWSNTAVLAVLYGLTRPDAADRLRSALEIAGEDGGWAGGLAEYPGDGPGAAALLEHAEGAADAVSSQRALFPSAGAEGGSLTADVGIVEDDEALGLLLVRSLEDRGHTTHWIRDGMEALGRLTGDPPEVRARVLLLDVGLPGLDGLSLLRQLAQAGVTRRTRVVMLTARSAETEVVRALELGAFDHVPKPFSVSELTQRVRRALEDRRFE